MTRPGLLRIAARQALASLRFRALRQVLTGLGILLGVAMLAAVGAYRESAPAGSLDRATWFGAMAFLMCLLGVTNSMIIAVAERTKEIGTIKCLGASDALIVVSLGIEALLLGVVFSGAGALLGSGVMAVFTGVPMSGIAIGQAAGIGIALTLAASLIPAWQAARLPAASAMRVDV